MDYSWLDTQEYWEHIKTIKENIKINALIARNEAQTAEAFQNELYYYIRFNTGVQVDFKPETPIKGGMTHNFRTQNIGKSGRGKLDAIVNDLIIEYKNCSKLKKPKDQINAINQVKDYLVSLYKTEHINYNAILTDGIKIVYFSFDGEEIKNTSFKSIEDKDIDCIIRAILNNSSKKFVAKNILKDFSVDKSVDTLSKKLAVKLYKLLCKKPTEKTTMLFSEWESLMHLSYEDNGKGSDIKQRRRDLSLIFSDNIKSNTREYKAFFALQTTYAIIVKLIACKVINVLDSDANTKNYADLTKITASDLQLFLEKLEDGYVYKSSNILNLLEGDFFSWYSTSEQWDSDLWYIIKEVIIRIDEYSTFSFDITYSPIDIFKDLYMSIIPRSIRHSMGEYFTPSWLADYVIGKGLSMVTEHNWKALDPCCGSGTFIIQLIKHVVGNVDLYALSEEEKEDLMNKVLDSVYGIDINPLSVLSARVGYYLALRPFGLIHNIEIPIYLGDSAITPTKEIIDGIECFKYSVSNKKKTFDVILPSRFVRNKSFGLTMSSLQDAVKQENEELLFQMIKNKLSEREKRSNLLLQVIKELSTNLVELHKNNWDGIWVRIATNFMLIARLSQFDLIVGNPPWVKWEHLPSLYAKKIKKLCNIRHIFSTRGRFGGTQLNICALISNVAATNWLKESGVLAFLMPDSIMSQNSYEEFRYFYIDYENKSRLYLQHIDKWEKPLKPFPCSQDFNTYYYSNQIQDYSKGIDVTTISRNKSISDSLLNRYDTFEDIKNYLFLGKRKAIQCSKKSTAFTYMSDLFDFNKIIGRSAYEYRTGVEFTPLELYTLEVLGNSTQTKHCLFCNKKYSNSKYKVDDMPINGWDLPVQYIFPIVTGPSLSPFKCNFDNDYCILPYDSNHTEKPISTEEMIKNNNDLFRYLLSHQSLIDKQSEKSKTLHRGDEFYAISKIGPYTFAPYIVAVRDNTKFCSSIIEKKVTPWGERKQSICVKHTIIISRDLTGRFISEDESHFINGILNSNVVIEYIHNTFKTNGFSLKKSNIYLPLYDKLNDKHNKIVDLSKEATNSNDLMRIRDIQSELSSIYLQICMEK